MTQRATCETLAKAGVRTKSRPLRTAIFAGILGLEPRLTGPEPVVLPITPYPTDLLVHALSAEAVGHGGEHYTRPLGATKTPGPAGVSVMFRSRIRCATHSTRARYTSDWVRVTGIVHQLPPTGFRVEAMSPNASARPNASQLLSTCIAMPASSPPVRTTSRPATMPNANRSKKIGALCEPCATANSRAGSTTAAQARPNSPPKAWVR